MFATSTFSNTPVFGKTEDAQIHLNEGGSDSSLCSTYLGFRLEVRVWSFPEVISVILLLLLVLFTEGLPCGCSNPLQRLRMISARFLSSIRRWEWELGRVGVWQNGIGFSVWIVFLRSAVSLPCLVRSDSLTLQRAWEEGIWFLKRKTDFWVGYTFAFWERMIFHKMSRLSVSQEKLVHFKAFYFWLEEVEIHLTNTKFHQKFTIRCRIMTFLIGCIFFSLVM